MTKFLLFALIVWFALRYRRRAASAAGRPERRTPEAERMVRCARCGVHFPESERVEAGGRVFCSAAHRDGHAA